MDIPVRLPQNGYTITIERGALQRIGERFPLDRKVLIVTDDGVPASYAVTVAKACRRAQIETVPAGEGSKSFPVLERLLKAMLSQGMTRKDCVVTVGGGVVSDLGGLAAALYMRGIDFYAVPTTVLSAVDASVGGKTAINFNGIKNIVGAFWQPRGVLIDPETLRTLSKRQLSNGLAEAVKMALTCDKDLFARFETQDPLDDLDEIIARSVRIKRDVVERDERESDLRRILNFGHTIGHGIESAAGGRLYHGESVALGMLPMCSEPVREALLPVLLRLGLPTGIDLDPRDVFHAAVHDKKATAGGVAVVRCDAIGSCYIETIRPEALLPLIETVTEGETL